MKHSLPLEFFCMRLYRNGGNFSLVQFYTETIWAWISLFRGSFYLFMNSIPLIVIRTSKLSVSDWMSFFPRNWSISSKLSIFCVCRFIYDIPHFLFDISEIISYFIISYISYFIPNIGDLWLFSWSFYRFSDLLSF